MKILRLQGELERQQGIYYEYDVESSPLGEGGMGRVFQGFRITEHNRMHTQVAIKEIYDDLPPNVIERAKREASVQIENDHLIRMYSFIETSVRDEHVGITKIRYYVIMELLIGVTLEEFLKGQVVTKQGIPIAYASQLHTTYIQNKEEAVLKIIKSILSGIMALHDQGYIHRDIDPTNIMITHNGKIKLIDFGICKPIRSLYTPNSALTQYGAFMGKIHYAAPELVMGHINLQNETTDIYAVGILLYQLCTGRLPFSGTHLQLHQAQLKQKVPVQSISHRGIRKIILKATHKKQGKRYASAAEFRVALDRLPSFPASNSSDTANLKKAALYGSAFLLLVAAAWIGLSGLSPKTSSSTEVENNLCQPVDAFPPTENEIQPESHPQPDPPVQSETMTEPEESPQKQPVIPSDVSLTSISSPLADKATLDISEPILRFPASGGKKPVIIQTNRTDWKAVANASWYKTQKGKNELWITATPNHSTSERNSDLVVMAGPLKKIIHLQQEGIKKEKKPQPGVTQTPVNPLPPGRRSDANPEPAAQPVDVSRETEASASPKRSIHLDSRQVDQRSYDIRSSGQSDYLIILRGTGKSSTRVPVGQVVEVSFPLKNKNSKITICKTGSNGSKAQFYYSATSTQGISYTKEIDEAENICHLHFSLPSPGEYAIYIKGNKAYFFIGAD